MPFFNFLLVSGASVDSQIFQIIQEAHSSRMRLFKILLFAFPELPLKPPLSVVLQNQKSKLFKPQAGRQLEPFPASWSFL